MGLLLQSELNGLIDSALKETGLVRKGNNAAYHCPFCQHHKRKLEISLDTRVWHCWVCDAKGRSIRSLFKKMRLDAEWLKRLRAIIDEPAGEFAPIEVIHSPTAEHPPVMLPPEFCSLSRPTDTRAYKKALWYAKKRKLTAYDVVKHNIGYCPDGEYSDRLIFPSYDANNKLNFFTGRSYSDEVYLKYKNPEVDRNIIGFENMVDFEYPVSLVEGPLDAIATKRNAVPLFGKTLSPKLKMKLMSTSVKEINIILDTDARKMAMAFATMFLTAGKIVRMVDLSGKDPNVLGFAKTTEHIRDTPVLDFSGLMRMKLGM